MSRPRRCPTCGGKIDDVFALSRSERIIYRALSRDKPMTGDDLVWVLYGGKDEPAEGRHVAYMLVRSMRRKGVPIVTLAKRGYVLG